MIYNALVSDNPQNLQLCLKTFGQPIRGTARLDGTVSPHPSLSPRAPASFQLGVEKMASAELQSVTDMSFLNMSCSPPSEVVPRPTRMATTGSPLRKVTTDVQACSPRRQRPSNVPVTNAFSTQQCNLNRMCSPQRTRLSTAVPLSPGRTPAVPSLQTSSPRRAAISCRQGRTRSPAKVLGASEHSCQNDRPPEGVSALSGATFKAHRRAREQGYTVSNELRSSKRWDKEQLSMGSPIQERATAAAQRAFDSLGGSTATLDEAAFRRALEQAWCWLGLFEGDFESCLKSANLDTVFSNGPVSFMEFAMFCEALLRAEQGCYEAQAAAILNCQSLRTQRKAPANVQACSPRRQTPSDVTNTFSLQVKERPLCSLLQTLHRTGFTGSVSLSAERKAAVPLSPTSTPCPMATPVRFKDAYNLVTRLGYGGFGKTYICTEKATGQKRTCMVMNKQILVASTEKVRIELAMLMKLDHPNILRTFHWFEDLQNMYLIVDAVKSEELPRVIATAHRQGEHFTEKFAITVIYQVLEGVAHCHSKSLAHKDVKPSNILLTTDEHGETRVLLQGVRLGELFTSVNHLGKPKVPCTGSFEFMPPEAIAGDFGLKGDVWSTGVVLFQLITGLLPYPSECFQSATEYFNSIAVQEPNWGFFKNASALVLSLCRRMLVRQEASRPSAGSCLRHKWFSSAHETGANPLFVHWLVEKIEKTQERKYVQSLVAAEMDVSKLSEVKGIFEKLDTSSAGTLSWRSFSEGLADLGVSKEVNLRACSCLQDMFGMISYSEFMTGTIEEAQLDVAHCLWRAFESMDGDHDGSIAQEELQHILFYVQRSEDDAPCLGLGDDVEAFFRRTLQDRPGLILAEAPQRLAGKNGRVTFEALFAFIVNAS